MFLWQGGEGLPSQEAPPSPPLSFWSLQIEDWDCSLPSGMAIPEATTPLSSHGSYLASLKPGLGSRLPLAIPVIILLGWVLPERL